MEKKEVRLTADKERNKRVKAAEKETEVSLFLDKEKTLKKKPSERRNSQGPLTYILNENYIGEEDKIGIEFELNQMKKRESRALSQDTKNMEKTMAPNEFDTDDHKILWNKLLRKES